MLLILEVYSLDVLRHSECNGERLAPQVLWQLVEELEVEVQLFILLTGDERGVKLDWQHVKRTFQFILHGDALPQRRLELERPRVHYLIIIDGLVDLRHPYLISILHRLVLILVGTDDACCLS